MRTEQLGLQPTDLVLDFGGYRGDYAAELRERYDCTVHVFEPVPEFVEGLKARFRADSKVVIHDYAVGKDAGNLEMRMEADASGAYARGPAVVVPVVAAASVADRFPGTVAMAKLNIEGGEYELLPAMHETGLLARIDRLFVQFHDISTSSAEERRKCHDLLGAHHTCDYNYEFVWESWSLRTHTATRSGRR